MGLEISRKVKTVHEANLVRKLQKIASAIRKEKISGDSQDMMQYVKDNHLGMNIVQFCQQYGITLEQLEEFIENHDDILHYSYDPVTKSTTSVSMTVAGTVIKSFGGSMHPACPKCGNPLFEELPVCGYCGALAEVPREIYDLIEEIENGEELHGRKG